MKINEYSKGMRFLTSDEGDYSPNAPDIFVQEKPNYRIPNLAQSFAGGGSVKTPKRGLVDEPGSYAGKEFTDQQLLDLGFSKGSNLQPQKETYKKLAEIFQQADIDDELEYLFQPSKNNPKGKITNTRNVFNKLPEDEKGLKYIANLLGEDVEFVLDMIDDKKILEEMSRTERMQKKKILKKEGLDKDFGKVENWMLKNASKYSDPDKFKKATVNRFGKKNAAIKAMTSGGGNFFSTEFNNDILGYKGSGNFSKINKSIGDNIFRTTIYNFNPNVRKAVTNEFKSILSGGPAEVQAEARKKIKQSKLFKKFGLTKKIHGPISRLIYKEVGEELYKNLQSFRNPIVFTTDLIRYLEGEVDPKYKGQFKQARIAMEAASANEFKKARQLLGMSDKIMFDHKIPSSFIKAGYADEIEYIKTTPTTGNFNVKIKNKQYDVPVNKLLRKFEKAKTPEAKQVIYNLILEKHNNFSKKYGGYLDNVKPSFTDGKIKFSSDASPVSKKTDFIKEFTKAGVQTGELNQKNAKNLANALAKAGFRCGAAEGLTCDNPKAYFKDIKIQTERAKKGQPDAIKKFENAGNVARKSKGLLKSTGYGILGEAGFEGAFVLNDILSGMPIKEAFQRSLFQYVTPKDFGRTKDAEASKTQRIVGDDPRSQQYVKDLASVDKLMSLYDRYEETDSDVVDAYTQEEKFKAEEDLKNFVNNFDPKTFERTKFGSPEQQAFTAKEEVEDVNKIKRAMDIDPFMFDRNVRRTNTPLFGDIQAKQIGRRPIEDKLSQIASYGGVSRYAGGGIAKLAGKRFGRPPESGPEEGLASLMKYDNKY